MHFISYVKKLWRCDYSRENTLHNLKTLKMIAILKGSEETSGNSMDLGINFLLHLRVNNPFNPIIGFLVINSFRNKVPSQMQKKFKLIFYI